MFVFDTAIFRFGTFLQSQFASLFFSIFLLVLGIYQSSGDALAAAVPPQLHVEGNHIKDAHGNIVDLHGAALIDMKFLKRDRRGPKFMIDLLTDASRGWHANLLKLVVFPDNYLLDPAGYVNNYLQPAIDLCVNKRVYCIIDWQYVTNPYDVTNQTWRFWTDMATRYKDNPYIMFEMFSEPVPPENGTQQLIWDTWKNWAQDVVNAIRAIAPDNIILVGGPHYSGWLGGAVTNPIQGRNIGYAAHMYPGSYHPDATGANQPNPIGWQLNIGVVADRYPVFASEWGWDISNHIDTNGSRGDFGDPLKRWITSKGMSTCAWIADFNWYPTMFTDDSHNTTEFGQFAKDWWAEKF